MDRPLARHSSTLLRLAATLVVVAVPVVVFATVAQRLVGDRLTERALATVALERTHAVERSGASGAGGDSGAAIAGALTAAFGDDLVEATVVDAAGTVVWSSETEAIGGTVAVVDSGRAALAGTTSAVAQPDGRVRFLLPIADLGGRAAFAEVVAVDGAGVVVAAAADGAEIEAEIVRAALLAWIVGAVVAVVLTARQLRSSARHRQLALHDGLTGLANRSQFHDRLEGAISGAARANGRVGLVLLDLDGFKAINDTGGHAVGDRLLTRVATKLQAATRRNELPCRLGGDEFAVVVPNLASREELVALAERLHQELDLMVDFTDGRSLRVTASMGLALYPDDAMSADDLVSVADVGMYSVKANRKATMQTNLATAAARPYAAQTWH